MYMYITYVRVLYINSFQLCQEKTISSPFIPNPEDPHLALYLCCPNFQGISCRVSPACCLISPHLAPSCEGCLCTDR